MAEYIDMAKLLVMTKLAKSINEAKRLIKQGAVKIYPPGTQLKDAK